MANGTQGSPDLDDALNLFVGDVRQGKESAASAKAIDRTSHSQRRSKEKRTRTRSTLAEKSPSDASEKPAVVEKQNENRQSLDSSRAEKDQHHHDRPKAPTGRPAGVKSGEGRLKDKTSLSLDLELMDRYRNKCWDEHCQLGELIERALRDYAVRTWDWELQEAGSDN